MQKRIHISWDNEAKTILRRNADYGWTWDELDRANDEINTMLDSVDHTVCTLLLQNYSQHYMPPTPLAKLSAMLPRKHKRIGISVIVSQSSVVRSILGLLTQLYPAASHLRFANTLEEGRMLIKEYLALIHS